MIVITLFILRDINQMLMDAILQIVNITLTLERAGYVIKHFCLAVQDEEKDLKKKNKKNTILFKIKKCNIVAKRRNKFRKYLFQ